MNRNVIVVKDSLPFYIAYIVYFLAKYSEYLALNNLQMVRMLDLCKNMSYLLCFLIIVINLKNYSRVKLISIIVLCVVGAMTVYQVIFNDEKSLFVVLLFSMAYMGNDFRRFLKLNLWLHISCFLLTVVMSFLGVAENVVTEQEKFGVTWSRMSLGFNYPGQPMMFMIPIVFLFYYVKKRLNLMAFFVSLLMVASVYFFSQTIMPALICVGFITVVSFLRRFAEWKQIYWLIPCSVICTYIILFLYSQDVGIAKKIDRISNYRFSLGLNAIEDWGIHWLATGFKNINTQVRYLIVDSEYIYMLVSNGVLYTLIAIVLFTILVKWAVAMKDLVLVWVFLFLAAHAVFNNGIYNLLMDPFIMVLCPMLWGNWSTKKMTCKISLNKVWKINTNIKI